MTKKFFLLARLFISLLMVQACVEPFTIDIKYTKKVLIVDGSITDQDTPQSITIKQSLPTSSVSTIFPVKDAKVEVLVNDKDIILLTDKGKNGIYFFPDNYKIQYDTKYKLSIKTADGSAYESTTESMARGPKIDSVYAIFKSTGIDNGSGTAAGHYVYLDTKDPKSVKNNYFWTWKLWERQGYCETCTNSKYFYVSRARAWQCVPEADLIGELDYACEGNCWEVFYSTELNVLNDANSDGRPIVGRLMAKIPFYQFNGALLEVTQQSVSPTAYKYLSLLIEQGQNTGTLADTPPAALVGNIRNINDQEESVGGIFMVASTQTKKMWLPRTDADKNAFPVGLFGGRPAQPEVSSDPTRPPLAACINSRTRTNIKPTGWKN
jgi:Domain of unknown function (DUF4249)